MRVQLGKREAVAIVVLLLLGAFAVTLAWKLLPQPVESPQRNMSTDHRVQVVIDAPGKVEAVSTMMHAGPLAASTNFPASLHNEAAVNLGRGFSSSDTSRFSIRLNGDFPAGTHIAVGLAGLLVDGSRSTGCFLFTLDEADRLMQSPTELVSTGVDIAGWKLNAPGYGYSEASRHENAWAENVLTTSAAVVMIACDTKDSFSIASGAASTIEFPPVTVVTEGQETFPTVDADFTVAGAIDLRVLAGDGISSPRPGLFVLKPEWSSKAGETRSTSEIGTYWFKKDTSSPVGVMRSTVPPDQASPSLGILVRLEGRWTQVESVSGQSQSQLLAAVGGGVLGFGLGLLAPIGAYLWKAIPAKSSKPT